MALNLSESVKFTSMLKGMGDVSKRWFNCKMALCWLSHSWITFVKESWSSFHLPSERSCSLKLSVELFKSFCMADETSLDNSSILENMWLLLAVFSTKSLSSFILNRLLIVVPTTPTMVPKTDPIIDQYFVFSAWALSFSWESLTEWDKIAKFSLSSFSICWNSSFNFLSSLMTECSRVTSARYLSSPRGILSNSTCSSWSFCCTRVICCCTSRLSSWDFTNFFSVYKQYDIKDL